MACAKEKEEEEEEKSKFKCSVLGYQIICFS